MKTNFLKGLLITSFGITLLFLSCSDVLVESSNQRLMKENALLIERLGQIENDLTVSISLDVAEFAGVSVIESKTDADKIIKNLASESIARRYSFKKELLNCYFQEK